MPHPSHNEELTPEREAYYDMMNSFVRLYVSLKREGIECFDDDGLIGDHDGAEIINLVLRYYTELELYENCVVLRDRLAEYNLRYPHKSQSEHHLLVPELDI